MAGRILHHGSSLVSFPAFLLHSNEFWDAFTAPLLSVQVYFRPAALHFFRSANTLWNHSSL